MALEPDEQESQIVALLHSPPPEQNYLNDAFPNAVDGFRDTSGEERYNADEENFGSEVHMDGIVINTPSILQQSLSQTIQQDSNQFFVGETQSADIEMDTQGTEDNDQSAQKDAQNTSFGSQSFVEETQFVGIEMDTQAIEDTTQFANPNPPSQNQVIQRKDQSVGNAIHHTNLSPVKFLSRPKSPEGPIFKFSVAAHAKKNREPSAQNSHFPKVAAQSERAITKPLPKVILMPDPCDETPTKPVQPTRRALPGDHNAAAIAVSDGRACPSLKPSVMEKQVIPSGQNTTLVERLVDTQTSFSVNSVRPPSRVPHTVCNTSTHHRISDVQATSSVQTQLPEQEARPVIQNASAVGQLSDARNLPLQNPVNPPVIMPTSVLQQVSNTYTSSFLKALVLDKEIPPVARDASAPNPHIQLQTKRVTNPLTQAKEIFSTPHGNHSHSASAMVPSKIANDIEEPSNLLVPKASHKVESRLAGLHPSQQGTPTPTHVPQRSRLRQKSSNKLNRFSIKTKFNVQGNLVKKAPFPEAFSDQPKVQIDRDRPSRTPSPLQLDTKPQYPESQLDENDLSTRIDAPAETLESSKLSTNNGTVQTNQPQGNTIEVAHPRAKNSHYRTEDLPMTSVEYEEDLPAGDYRQPHQSIQVSHIQPDHQTFNPAQHTPVYRQPSHVVSQANTSITQSQLNTPRPQPTVRAQTPHQTQRRPMNRPMQPHDLEPQGVSETAPSCSSQTKISKRAAAVNCRGENNPMAQSGDHIRSQQKRPPIDLDKFRSFLDEVESQRLVIQEQDGQILNLNAKLQDAETRLQDKCAINTELEARKNELSKRVERLNDLSNRYRQHFNEVVICQKALRQDSEEMKKSVRDLRNDPLILRRDENIEDRQVQQDGMRILLEKIKEAQREQNQQDSRNANLENLMEQIDGLRRANESLKTDVYTKSVELQQERHQIKQLQDTISKGELDRHKEVMEILQKPHVDTLGELIKEDGILHKVLNSNEGLGAKLDGISKNVKDAVTKTSEWPQTLAKSLDEFYSKIQTKLDDSGSKDTTFQESTVKLFGDLKDRLNQFKGDLDEKTKLSEQLRLLRENNATLKANLNSKETESENNMSRLNELTRELADISFKLTKKTEELAISNAQPREDPAMKKKVENMTTEALRLQTLVTTANDDKLKAENSLQTQQAILTTVQKQLRETEEKLRYVESAIETLEGKHQKFVIESRTTVDRARQETIQLSLYRKKGLEASHEIVVNDLKDKQAETEKKLQAAVEESKSSRNILDEQAKNIGKLESEIATYKDQLLQQKLQLQNLEENSISSQLLKQKEDHQQEILSIRQEQANQRALSQACRDESLKIEGELEGAQKRLQGMKEENEHLKRENDRLRQRSEGINAMAENSQKFVSNLNRADDFRPPSRRPAERRSSNVHNQAGVTGGNQRKVPDFSTNTFLTSSFSRAYGDNNGESSTPIKPFSIIDSLGSSPLTDLEDIMPKVQSAHSREELEQVYNQNRQVSYDKIAHIESVVRSKCYSHGEVIFSTPNSKRNTIILSSEGGLISTPNQISRSIPSVAQESIQRRVSKPLKSAMKKGDYKDSPITLSSSQHQAHSQQDESEIFKKPVLRNIRGLNGGLQATSRTGASSYNRIATGKPNVPGSRASGHQSKAAPLYEPTPEIKRNAMKRARSTSTFGAQDLQPAKPAKAPKFDFRQPPNDN